MKNRIAALSLTLALTVGVCAPAQAADSQTVQATLNAGITVTMDGTPQTFRDVQGAVVLPVTYNGTAYLPVRAVSALVGLGVEWEAETQTVKLTTPEDPTPTANSADGSGDGLTSQTVPALLNGAITVTLDGAAQTFHDAQGAVVLPLTYNGTTYLPVRAVCGLVGLPVEWVQETSTVKLGEAPRAEIPEGALLLTGDNVKLQATQYIDGKFIMDCNGITSTGSFITIKNDGYSTLTLTAKATASEQLIGIINTSGLHGKLLFSENMVDNIVETYTVDITGSSEVSITICNGRLSNGEIYDMYLLP